MIGHPLRLFRDIGFLLLGFGAVGLDPAIDILHWCVEMAQSISWGFRIGLHSRDCWEASSAILYLPYGFYGTVWMP